VTTQDAPGSSSSPRPGPVISPHWVGNGDGRAPGGGSRDELDLKVDLFIGCFNDTLFPNTGKATVAVLERLGHSVGFPLDQTCCGQMHFNTGYRDETLRLTRHFVEAFSESEVVVSPAASCVGMVREAYPTVAELDPGLAAAVKELAPRVFELSEFLVDNQGIVDTGSYFPHRVAYHPTCHSLRMLRVGDTPLRLLRQVRGLELVEPDRADECCGFGGTFALKNAETSSAILADKVRNLVRTGAEMCVALDNSCLMHIGGALARQKTGLRTMHLAEVLAAQEPPR
jgi:L-lactate dehydrogenase complex protein LldE